MFSATPSDFDDAASPFNDEPTTVHDAEIPASDTAAALTANADGDAATQIPSRSSLAATPPEPSQRARTPQNESTAKLDFEVALEQLQQIVGRLERGSGSLESSLSDFEAGMSLLRSCYSTLEHAERRIELLTRISTDGSQVETEPFDATATFTSAESSADEHRAKGRSTKTASAKGQGSKVEPIGAKKSASKKAKPAEPRTEFANAEPDATPASTLKSALTPTSGLPGSGAADDTLTPPFEVSADSSPPDPPQDQPQRTTRSPGNLFDQF